MKSKGVARGSPGGNRDAHGGGPVRGRAWEGEREPAPDAAVGLPTGCSLGPLRDHPWWRGVATAGGLGREAGRKEVEKQMQRTLSTLL